MALITVSKIADYFISVANETGSYLSNLKLQKRLYYAQAWHLALYGISLFHFINLLAVQYNLEICMF